MTGTEIQKPQVRNTTIIMSLIVRITNSNPNYDTLINASLKFLRARFARGLLILGDLSASLKDFADIYIAKNNQILGFALVFWGFNVPVISIVCDDICLSRSLLSTVQNNIKQESILVLNIDEPILKDFVSSPFDEDFWLVRDTKMEKDVQTPTVLINDPDQLTYFYSKYNMHFWNKSMFEFKHFYGVRNSRLQLIAVAGVNFILYQDSYAQIGNVLTDKNWRNKGLATTCMKTLIYNLRKSNINQCGLFVDSKQPNLFRLYEKLGFRQKSCFRFISI